MAFVFHSIALKAAIYTPVSYTHLDVYKRQSTAPASRGPVNPHWAVERANAAAKASKARITGSSSYVFRARSSAFAPTYPSAANFAARWR